MVYIARTKQEKIGLLSCLRYVAMRHDEDFNHVNITDKGESLWLYYIIIN